MIVPFCRQFGNPGTQYDWGRKTIIDLDHKVKELEENQREMKKKVNPKVMNMIDKWVVFFCSVWYSD
jgi:structural maintenance of chromosome 2